MRGGQVRRADAPCGEAEKRERERERRKGQRRRRETDALFISYSFLLLFPQIHPVLRAGDARLPLIRLRASVPP
jgi:hypothetical protein